MIKTSWIDPVTNKEYSYNWGYDFEGLAKRKPFRANENENKKEKTMRFDNNTLSRLNLALKTFATNNGLIVESEFETCHPDVVRVIFRKAVNGVGKTFYIHACMPDELNNAVSKMYDSVIAYFHLDTAKAKAVKPVKTVPDIKNAIFNNPVTVVLWADGTKTIVRCTNEDYDPEKGLAMAIAKKALGNSGNYFEEFKKWIKKDEETEDVTEEENND